MDEQTELKLIGMHRSEYELAKSNEIKAWICQIVVALTASLSIFISSEKLIYLTTIIALISIVCEKWFTHQSKKQKDIAERARRMILLVDGLGYEVSQKEITDLLRGFSSSEASGKKWEDIDYYYSPQNHSSNRLRQILQESAFYSEHLYKESANISWVLFGIIFIFSLVTLFILPLLARTSWTIVVANTICIILMFIITIDLSGRAVEFNDTANLLQQIDDRLEYTQKEINEHDLMLILSDYNTAVACTPLIPTIIYKSNKQRLDKLWKNRLSK
jgi:hypothetical protein